VSLSLTGDTGRIGQLDVQRARADSAPDKSISALVVEYDNEIDAAAIDLQQIIIRKTGVVYMTFVLDTGCSTTLSSTEIHRVLNDMQPSTIRIRGFKGTQREPGLKHGRAYMYALSADPKQPGTPVAFSVDTVKSINHNLYSITEAFETQGFDVHLQHNGFSGLIKTDENGNEQRIPAHYDWDSHQWLIHAAIAADYNTVRNAGLEAEQRIAESIDCNSTEAQESVYLALPDQISVIVDRRGVVTMRDDDHITSIDVDALITLVEALNAADDSEDSDKSLELVAENISKFDTA